MGAHVTEQSEQQEIKPSVMSRLRDGFQNLNWTQVLIIGVLAGVLMPLVLTGGDIFQLFAGVVPVGAGLILGRRVRGHYMLHGFMTGLVATIVGVIVLSVLIFSTPIGDSLAARAAAQGAPPELSSKSAQFGQLAPFVAIALLTFVSFGTSMAGRTEQRNRLVREEVASRGGQLERAPTVREESDIRGMSLPQFGSYVNGLWKKQGFAFKDYRFIDKDKHLDLWMEKDGEPWHLRLSVADKVAPGTIEGLFQDMKREGCKKGVVITSTEFTPGATKAATNRPIVLVDGATLFEIAEK